MSTHTHTHTKGNITQTSIERERERVELKLGDIPLNSHSRHLKKQPEKNIYIYFVSMHEQPVRRSENARASHHQDHHKLRQTL